MKFTTQKYHRRTDSNTFQSFRRAEIEWSDEDSYLLSLFLQRQNLTETSVEFYSIIGKALMDSINAYVAPILTWENPFTIEELKAELIKNGVSVFDDFLAPSGFPMINGIIVEDVSHSAMTRKLDQKQTIEEVALEISNSAKNFAIYKLSIPHYHEASKSYIIITDEQFDILSEDEKNGTSVYPFMEIYASSYINTCSNEPELLGKIKFASW